MKTFLKLVVILIGFTHANAQEFGNNAIKLSAAFADVSSSTALGFGWTGSVGFQKSFWKDRLRVCPSVSFGTLTTKNYTDVSDYYFNNRGFNFDIYISPIRIKGFSIFLGAGAFAHNLSGIRSGYSPFPAGDTYFRHWYGGTTLGAGIRIAPAKSRVAFEFMPVTYSWNRGQTYELATAMRLQLDIKLGAKK